MSSTRCAISASSSSGLRVTGTSLSVVVLGVQIWRPPDKARQTFLLRYGQGRGFTKSLQMHPLSRRPDADLVTAAEDAGFEPARA